MSRYRIVEVNNVGQRKFYIEERIFFCWIALTQKIGLDSYLRITMLFNTIKEAEDFLACPSINGRGRIVKYL